MNFREKQQYQEHYELVEKHIEKYFKEANVRVFHEIPTLDIHLDVYHIQSNNLQFDVLLTSGMSSIEMNVDEILEDSVSYKFAELMVLIPKGIDFGDIYPSKTKNDWIISMIKQSAKFPHFYDTWIGMGHTLQADEGMIPYSVDTEYCGCIVLPTVTLPEEFGTINSPNGVINIYGLFPMYKEELNYKIKNGFDSFMDLLIKNNGREVIDFNRKNFCQETPKKGFSRFFKFRK
ncbi:suppressor of fused domain protein [Sediminitomix flava]|uniref:Suppressor of fused protein SUFU n=1 Tax=Sediminitomix flava TaxID=379075 RepID=A0A315YW16_SEDFL|nr:suppressor of fused domain protein [Sediminitomix flava]PWJ33504.1 suppressor of fused protein SUFU [Sediminitomix flava]